MTSVSLFASATRLPARERGERRIESGGADDGVEHDVDVVARRRLDEACVARRPSPRASPSPFRTRPTKRRREARRLLGEQRGVVERRERGDAEALALPLEHAQRGRADRAGRPEDGDAARASPVTTGPTSAAIRAAR